MIAKAQSPLVGRVHPSPNFEPRRGARRPDMIVLHYTGMTSCERAIEWLANPASKVSCHYVIDERGRITQMVSEDMRAWHAGVSWWAGETDINSVSIGIEIHNPGHALGYSEFNGDQMAAVIALAGDIASRHGVPAARILGHSDVAPGRKIDPGERFDWQLLWREGLGHWVAPVPVAAHDAPRPLETVDEGEVARVASMLRAYGYLADAAPAARPPLTDVVRAFQLHFRPERCDGCIDRSTIETLEQLIAALPAPPRATDPVALA